MAQIQKSSLKFLKDLANNNNRDWFTANKDKYTAMHENLIAFAEALMVEMNKHDQIVPATGKKTLFRIYRDVRFSKDKSPYKSHIGGSMSRDTPWLRGGYYFGIQPGGKSMIGCGFWNPNKDDLKLIREHIAAEPERLEKVFKGKKFKDTFPNLMEGEQLKTAPKGFPKDHPAIELLRYKQFLTYKPYKDSEVTDKGFLKQIVKDYKAVRPFFDYMSEILTHDLNGVALIK